MGKSKKRPRPASPTTNDGPGKKKKPTTLNDPSEIATVETGLDSSLAAEVKQSEEDLNARVREWMAARADEEDTLPPLGDVSDAEDRGEREEDEDCINQLWVESIMGRFKDQISKWSDEQKRKSFKYECEWKKCSFMTGKDQRYFRHVELHAEEFEPAKGVFTCLWDLCCFKTADRSDLISHVHVHGYHTKLKVHGASLSMLVNLPKCNYDSRIRNDISKIPLSYTCEWGGCGEKFDKIMQFIYHVVYHFIEKMPPGKKSAVEPVACRWPLCKSSFIRLIHALKHVQKHTKHREVACFNCGSMFLERVTYRNHCLRQVDMRYRTFKCDECDKYFATERLLKLHADGHLFHVPCPMCPKLFATPSGMNLHLRRIHLKTRSMACTQCEYRAYTACELKKHMIRHTPGRLFRCGEFGCNATFRHENTLKIHIIKHYNLPPPHYACHICEEGYASGWQLSKHLGFAHELKPKPGSCRFRYKADPEDGSFKLDSYIQDKKQKQENRERGEAKAPSSQREGSEQSSDGDDDDDNDDTAQDVRPAEGKTTIKQIKMIGENEIAIDLGMEFTEGNTDQSEEQPLVTKSVSIKKEKKSPYKNKEKAGSVESKEDKKTKKVQEFTVMKRYLKSA